MQTKTQRMGLIPLEKRKLTNVQKKLAIYSALNMPYEVIKSQCGISDFQYKSYMMLTTLQLEIQKKILLFNIDTKLQDCI